MKHCPECEVDFTGDLTLCPLCGHTLSGEVTPSPFPTILLKQKSHHVRIALGVITLLLLGVIVVSGIILSASPWLVLAGVLAIAINYLFVHTILSHNPDFIRGIQRYLIVLVLMAFLGWLGFRTEVFPAFVIPLTCLMGSTFDLVSLTVFGGKLISEYGKYVFLAVVIGFLPLIIIISQATPLLALNYLSIFVSLVLLFVLLVSWRKEIASELHRLFNLS